MLKDHFRKFAEAMPHVVWTATAEGAVDYSSRLTLQGYKLVPETSDVDWLQNVHRDDLDRCLPVWEASVRSGQKLQIEFRIYVDTYEAYRWHLVSAVPIRDDDGKILKWLGSSIDIHDRKEAEESSRVAAERLRNTLGSITDGFFSLSKDWVFEYLNPAAERLLRRSEALLSRTPIWEVLPAESGSAFLKKCAESMRDQRALTFEDEDTFGHSVEVRTYPSNERLAVYIKDVSEQKKTLRIARENQERFELVARATSDVIWDWDVVTDSLWWNENAEHQFGIAPGREDDITSRTERIHPEDRETVFDSVKSAIDLGTQLWTHEYRFRREDGSYADVFDRGFILRHDGEPIRMVGSMIDISASKASQAEIQRLAFNDSLTELPNRTYLRGQLDRMLQVHARDRLFGAVLFIDLDNFKRLNDSRGHDKGDLLLTEVGRRLKSSVRKEDLVARLGGDEFVVVFEQLGATREDGLQRAEDATRKILSAFSQPFLLEGHHFHCTASIGITLIDPDRTKDVSSLLKQADMAMYEAKSGGRNRMHLFSAQTEQRVMTATRIESALRTALESDQFALFLQPQVDHEGGVVGAEALLRWWQASGDVVSPHAFIGIAEQTGQIVQIGEWVLERACSILAQWSQGSDLSRLHMSVNVSASQFLAPSFSEMVLEKVARHRIASGRLWLELTESVFIEDYDGVATVMNRLKKHGIRFSLDDFGTGYSSLSALRRLPLDQLKIDRSFVADIPGNNGAEAIVRSILDVGDAHGMTVVAEGVETDAQRDFLLGLGCTSFQGFLFGRPMTEEVFERFIKV